MSSTLSRSLRLPLKQVNKLSIQSRSVPPSCHQVLPSQATVATTRTISTTPVNREIIVIKNNEEFLQKVVNSNRSVIVNFHADWCNPCEILTPRLKSIIGPMENIDLAILNVEDHIELVAEFEVKAVPAVIAFRDGVVKGKFIGLAEDEEIVSLVKQVDLPPMNSGGQTPADEINKPANFDEWIGKTSLETLRKKQEAKKVPPNGKQPWSAKPYCTIL